MRVTTYIGPKFLRHSWKIAPQEKRELMDFKHCRGCAEYRRVDALIFSLTGGTHPLCLSCQYAVEAHLQKVVVHA